MSTSPAPPSPPAKSFWSLATFSLSSPATAEPDFDAGINASTAWTEHLERTSTYDSDSSTGKEGRDVPNRISEINLSKIKSARALYPFEGQVEFKELAGVRAGDALEILKEDLAGGWSLARLLPRPTDSSEERRDGPSEPGLIPRTYYAFTTDFSTLPGEQPADSGTSTPKSATQPLQLQHTGSGYVFPYLRQSLLGGKSLNRFSSFVTSGAEEYVLNGPSEVDMASKSHYRASTSSFEGDDEATEGKNEDGKKNGLAESEQHFIEAPHSWRSKSPPFRILVHSPSKRASTITGSYTLYAVTSLFKSEDESHPKTHVTVHRRFSHFTFLHAALSRYLPGIAFPPLPEKQYAGRFNEEFVEARRGDLERWINRVARHPLVRYSEVLIFFLGCESDSEWRRVLPHFLAEASATNSPAPSFYAHVSHPAFNLDAEDASDAVDRFQTHLRAVGKSVQGLRGVFAGLREGVLQMASAQRLFSYSILSLLTSTPLQPYASTANGRAPSLAYSFNGFDEDENEEQLPSKHTNKDGLMNKDGAWCWREDCDECLRLSKALQKTAECLHSVADLHDDHARRTQLATHESLKDVAHPLELYTPVIDTHRSTLSRYRQAVATSEVNGTTSDTAIAARCETVLNTTMAEFETYHTQKVEDFRKVATEHLDGEIAFYEQVLTRLRTARAAFNPPPNPVLPPGPRQPSIYERDLSKAYAPPPPLPQPAAHVFDSSASIRPVSVAIRESIGIIFGAGGTANNNGRGSVFGRFW